jgi:ABC-type amino acid transport system permease subunit
VIATIGRWLFVFGLFLSWANSAVHVALSDRPLYIRSARVFQGGARTGRVMALSIATLPVLGLCVAFLRGLHLEWVALAILVLLATIRRFEILQWPGDIVVRLGKYVPAAACLLAWLVSQPILKHFGFSSAEANHLGWNAACGVMAGAYVLAAIAKLRETGWKWMKPRYQALLVAERAYLGPALLRRMRSAIAHSRRASAVVGATGFFVELFAILFVVPLIRPYLLGVVLVLNFGFLTLLGYFELEWMVVLVAITLLAA